MIKLFKIVPFTRLLLTVYFLLLGVNYAFNNAIVQLLALNPHNVIHNFEIWRLLSFILVPGNIESTLFLSFVFWFIGPILEFGFKKTKFILLFALCSLIEGSLFTLLFIRNNTLISGGEGVAFMILTLYVFLEVTSSHSRISLRRFVSLPSAVFVTVLWFSTVIIHHSFAPREDLILSVISGAFGVMVGTFIFMHIKLIDYLTGRKKHVNQTYTVPRTEELISAQSALHEIKRKHIFHEEEEPEEEISYSEYFSEEKLNRILEKISDFGRESLSPDEELYLKEYSENL